MIKLLRVDHRLLHGQVAFSWTKDLEANCILIASDTLPKDELKMMAMKMAKPSGIKLVIKTVEDSITALNSGSTDKYKLFIVVESIEDAYRLAQKVDAIKSINLGGMKNDPNKKQVSKAVHIGEEDVKMLKELDQKGIELEIRLVPNDKKENIMNLI